jgi:superoxide reductase
MRRRTFLWTAAALALPLGARAQPQRRRRGWSATGPLDGREPADAEVMSPEESAHVPVIVLPSQVRIDRPFDLVVQVGVQPHPMNDAHRVEWIEVALDEARVFIADLGENVAFPIVRFSMTMHAPALLTARAYCSQHGTWRTRRQIDAR